MLAKFITPIWFPLTIKEYTVKGSFTFAKEIIKTDCNYAMASLDVQAFLTTFL